MEMAVAQIVINRVCHEPGDQGSSLIYLSIYHIHVHLTATRSQEPRSLFRAQGCGYIWRLPSKGTHMHTPCGDENQRPNPQYIHLNHKQKRCHVLQKHAHAHKSGIVCQNSAGLTTSVSLHKEDKAIWDPMLHSSKQETMRFKWPFTLHCHCN